jgi:Carboxypeptidase regulatory-like domain
MYRLTVFVFLAAIMIACSKDSSPTAPTPPPTQTTPPTQTPAPSPTPPVRVSVLGVVTNAATNQPVPNVAVRAQASNGTGSATTDGNGFYQIIQLAGGSITMTYDHPAFNVKTQPIAIDRDTKVDVRIDPLFRRSGVGNTVFDVPLGVTRVRITGDYTGRGENFIMRVGGSTVVNEIIGTGYASTHYEGTHLVTPGVAEVRSSTGVSWSIAQIR